MSFNDLPVPAYLLFSNHSAGASVMLQWICLFHAFWGSRLRSSCLGGRDLWSCLPSTDYQIQTPECSDAWRWQRTWNHSDLADVCFGLRAWAVLFHSPVLMCLAHDGWPLGVLSVLWWLALWCTVCPVMTGHLVLMKKGMLLTFGFKRKFLPVCQLPSIQRSPLLPGVSHNPPDWCLMSPVGTDI